MALDQSIPFTILGRVASGNHKAKLAILLGLTALAASRATAQAPYQGPPDHPSVVADGETYTPKSILNRNMGTAEEQETAFPPHKIIGNIYYVGTRTLSSYLIVTPAGNILLDTTYERNVPVILKSVEQLGFKFSDIKIVIGNHWHPDHMEGDALVKMLTGAQVEVMAEDAAGLRNVKPGGKEHPIDRIFHEGDTVSLGGTVLTSHLTPGHTHGATTWTTTVSDNGKDYHVVFFSSIRAPNVITPEVAADFEKAFSTDRSLPCDIPLGDHPSETGMPEKWTKLKPGGPNPYIDKAGCGREIDMEEAMYKAIVAEQRQQSAEQAKP
jgi:metallo-beta-lactamase class B